MYDLILELGQAITKHGLSLSALGTAIFVLLKQRKVKRLLRKRLPWLLRDDADVLNYQDRQIRIEAKVDALMSAGGIEWDAHSEITSKLPKVTDLKKRNSLYSLAGLSRAATIGVFISPMGRFSHSKIRGESTPMKKKLYSRKLWMTILGSVVIVLNQQLGIELSVDSIIGIGTLFMSFILGQSVVDTNGLGQYAPLLEKLKSSKLWVSIIGSFLIALNDEYQWGLSAENIYMLVGIAATFILGKSAVSVVQASKEASHYR